MATGRPRKVTAAEMPGELEEAKPCPHWLEPLPRGQESPVPPQAGSVSAAGGFHLTHVTLDSAVWSRRSQPGLRTRTPRPRLHPEQLHQNLQGGTGVGISHCEALQVFADSVEGH